MNIPHGLLPDYAIREYIPIEPFAEGDKRPGVISYGLSSAGYDARIGYKFKVFTPTHCTVVDPKNVDPRAFVDVDLTPEPRELHDWDFSPLSPQNRECGWCGHTIHDKDQTSNGPCPGRPKLKHVLIPPNGYILGESLETFDIPHDVMCVCLGKSTMARCGMIANVTPLEPGWKGKITIEISNSSPLPAKVYAGEGICQILFFRMTSPPENTYATKGGKYQSQAGLTLPRVD